MDHGPRQLLGPAFPGDTGEAAPEVRAALAAYAADRTDATPVLAALLEGRLLVPVVAILGEAEIGPDGLARDKSSDMAAVLLTGADGRLALLAFTGTDSLQAWNPDARPVPVPTGTAAQSALQEEAAAVVVDIAGPVPFVIEGEDLQGVARGWRPARLEGQRVWMAPGIDAERD